MKVFISSVRSGLETERDSLPGLIMALGHEPKRFEDFGAQAMPSREACLRGVNDSDAYLLLLGPKYGHLFRETGQSATHDEWVAAVTKGMPRLVFRKTALSSRPSKRSLPSSSVTTATAGSMPSSPTSRTCRPRWCKHCGRSNHSRRCSSSPHSAARSEPPWVL